MKKNRKPRKIFGFGIFFFIKGFVEIFRKIFREGWQTYKFYRKIFIRSSIIFRTITSSSESGSTPWNYYWRILASDKMAVQYTYILTINTSVVRQNHASVCSLTFFVDRPFGRRDGSNLIFSGGRGVGAI